MNSFCKCGCGKRVSKIGNKYIWGHSKNSKETRRKIGKGNEGKFVSKETKQKIREACLGRKHSAETIEKIRNSHIGKYPTEETKRKISKSKQGQCHSEETKRKIGLSSRRPCSEITKNKIRRANKGRTFEELFGVKEAERRQRELSQIVKRMWQDTEYIMKQMKARGVAPNKSEKQLNNLLKNLFPGEYKFVGDGQFIIGGKCPDFINVNGQKKIIEMFGIFWHSEKYRLTAFGDNTSNKEHKDQRIKHFAKYGYKTLIIWENQLQKENRKRLKKRLIKFHNKRG